MRFLSFCWGIAGVVGILSFAVYRLTPLIIDMLEYRLGLLHWIVLVAFTGYMAYAEGYKGFHQAFAPRVVLRADYLRHHAGPGLALVAPLFCMGYFHATRRRMITSYALTGAIIMLVIIVSAIPQPWRGIVDTGVVTGLMLGILSIVSFTAGLLSGAWQPTMSADLP